MTCDLELLDDEEYFFFESPLVHEGKDQRAVTEWVHKLKAEYIAGIINLDNIS